MIIIYTEFNEEKLDLSYFILYFVHPFRFTGKSKKISFLGFWKRSFTWG